MTDPQPGDFAVVRSNDWTGRVIRLVTRSHYNHAVFFISATEVVEAEPHGARITPWSYYAGGNVLTSAGKLPLSDAQRAHAWDVGRAFVLPPPAVPYGWLDILAVGLLQYGIRPAFVRNKVRDLRALICSQLVDVARTALGDKLFDDDRLAQDVTPGDLARLIGGI